MNSVTPPLKIDMIEKLNKKQVYMNFHRAGLKRLFDQLKMNAT
jgi:hypothetical protein